MQEDSILGVHLRVHLPSVGALFFCRRSGALKGGAHVTARVSRPFSDRRHERDLNPSHQFERLHAS